MTDNYGQQGQGWQGQPPPQGWQGQPQPAPGAGFPAGQPQPGQAQPGFEQPGAPQQGFPQQGFPQQGFPQQGPPQQGFPQQGFPQQGLPQGFPQGQPGWQPQAPKRKLGAIITAAVVVIALAVGLTIFLVSRKGDDAAQAGGSDTPQAAASNLVNSLSQKDAVGVAAQLDPAEADLFSELSGSIFDQLKRLKVVPETSDANAVLNQGLQFQDLKFAEGDGEKVSENVTVLNLIGGKVTINEAAFDPTTANDQGEPKTFDIAEELQKQGLDSIRVATVNRGGKWYPSLFYTAADNWFQEAKKQDPSLDDPALAQRIAAVGAGSPEEATRAFIDRSIEGNFEGMIGMLPPDEAGVLYDYGKRMLAAAGVESGQSAASGFQLTDLTFYTAAVDGGTKVSLKSFTANLGGQVIGLTINQEAGTIAATTDGKVQEFNINDIPQLIAGQQGMAGSADAIVRLAKGALSIGVVTTQVDGKWYVSPLRSFTGVFTTLLGALEPGDIEKLGALMPGMLGGF